MTSLFSNSDRCKPGGDRGGDRGGRRGGKRGGKKGEGGGRVVGRGVRGKKEGGKIEGGTQGRCGGKFVRAPVLSNVETILPLPLLPPHLTLTTDETRVLQHIVLSVFLSPEVGKCVNDDTKDEDDDDHQEEGEVVQHLEVKQWLL